MDEVNRQNRIQDRRRRKRAIKRTCPICGIDFYGFHDITGKFGSKRRRFQKYCSRKCWGKRNPPENKICELCECGKEFITYQRKQKHCSFDCRNKGMIGRKQTKETKEKMSEAKQGYMPINIFKSGKAHPFWNPNRTDQRERCTKQYKDWALAVYKKDNYTCQICGIRGKKGIRPKLHADHIKSFALYPELRFEILNGRTLCYKCHKKTSTFCRKKLK